MVDTVSTVDQEDPSERSIPSSRFTSRLIVPLTTCVLVAGLAQLPVLHDRWFYFTDDAATQFIPMWFRLGERIQEGQWPPLLLLDSWMGGNLAVEVLFGVWNPAYIGLWWTVSVLPDLLVSAVVIRTVGFVAVAFGCYLLAREYGAQRWAASAVAVALPFCGPMFYFDGAKWPAALLAFAWVPYLWWAVRRMARDRLNPVFVFILGALAVTSGNPYAMLAVCVVLTAVTVESGLLRGIRAVRRVLLVSLTVASLVPLVYLPLVLSNHVTWRSSGTVGNSGSLTPGLGDLVNLSFPNYVPEITGLSDAGIFFCWFASPLAAWLNWGAVRERWRELSGGLIVAGVFLLLAVGPAELWMFRWPLRILHYGYLACAVLLAVLLSAGLRTDLVRRRAFITAVLLAFSFYLGWAATPLPDSNARNLTSLLVLSLLTITAVCTAGSRWLPGVLQVGTILTFGLQVMWFLGSYGAMPYYYPTSIAESRAYYEDRYPGQVLMITDPSLIGPPQGPREAWRDLVPGNLHLPTGMQNINAYTGMGMAAFSDSLCFTYHGSTCAKAYPALWRTPRGIDVPLADLLQLDTVVVQRKLVDPPRPPRGWFIQERNGRVTVLRRVSTPERHAGRLSWTAPGLTVTANATPDDQHETVRFSRDGGSGRMVFTRLAWPGYTAEVDGARVPAYAGPAGLLEVRLPAGIDRGELELSWTPPRLKFSLAVAAAGLLGALAMGFASSRGKVPK